MANQIETYRHGGNPSRDLSRFDLQQRSIIDFSTSLNPLGIPPVIADHWPDLIKGVKDYPSVKGEGIAGYYRTRFGLSDKNILAGNGSTEIIYLIPRSLRLKQVVVLTPSFHDYERAAVLSGAKAIRVPLLNEGSSFGIDMESLVKALKISDAVWLARPNNPTANLFPKEMINDLASGFPDKLFIIDEAFMQFSDNWEEESFITGDRIPNMIVIHSLTKFYALAGLRMGGLIGHEDVISKIGNSKEPWTINGVADRAALLLKECEGYESESRAYVSRERDRIIKRLQEIDGIMPFPSTTNFILCRWTGSRSLDDLQRHLLANGMYVRDCRNFPGLEDNYFRIGLRIPEENDQLISLVSSCPVE
jgi:threonine-phosphate decarboxylase